MSRITTPPLVVETNWWRIELEHGDSFEEALVFCNWNRVDQFCVGTLAQVWAFGELSMFTRTVQLDLHKCIQAYQAALAECVEI